MNAVQSQKNLMQSFKQRTQVVRYGTGLFRCWDAGIGITVATKKSLRPALTNDQKSLMHPSDIEAYQTGKRGCHVPMLDDPF